MINFTTNDIFNDHFLLDGSYSTYIFKQLADGHYIDEYGSEYWFKNGRLHRIDGPANIWVTSSFTAKYWKQNGYYYREDNLPHAEFSGGAKVWYYRGISYNTLEEYMLARVMS